jgi:hypothetical protein
MNCEILSENARAKKPVIWQALVLTATTKSQPMQETQLIELSQHIYREEHKKQTLLQIVSLK